MSLRTFFQDLFRREKQPSLTYGLPPLLPLDAPVEPITKDQPLSKEKAIAINNSMRLDAPMRRNSVRCIIQINDGDDTVMEMRVCQEVSRWKRATTDGEFATLFFKMIMDGAAQKNVVAPKVTIKA